LGSKVGKNFTNEKVFIENGTLGRRHIKRRIIQQNLFPYKCKSCGLGEIWNNKKIVLQLDHINGINNDNRLENLRFLCPNCHSQEDTYAAKNRVAIIDRKCKPYYIPVSRRVVAVVKTSISKIEVEGANP
jgi:5-methylcytosine-specific restriction endonuclease McrA